MAIEAINNVPGAPLVRCICDGCGREEVVTCDYEHGPGNVWVPKEGQAVRKMIGRGWSHVKARLLCPACEAARRASISHRGAATCSPSMTAKGEGEEMKKTIEPSRQAPRTPTLAQRHEITGMLMLSYDHKAGRYTGAETDKTIAEAIGGGCLPGWVAEIREANFGPAGGNEEIEAIRAEIAAVQADCAERVAVLGKRLDAVCAAIGPRAARI